MFYFHKVLATLSTLLLCAVMAQAAPTRQLDQLTFSLSLSKTTIVPHEPIFATTRLRNDSTETIRTSKGEFASLRFLIAKGPKGEFVPHHPARGGFFKLTSYALFDLAPGSAITSSTVLFLTQVRGEGKMSVVFSEPGVYKIRAQTTYRKSQEVTITVKAPPVDDAAAARILAQPSAAKIVQDIGTSDEGVALLQALTAQYPESVLADYANYNLGQHFNGKSRMKWTAETGYDAEAAWTAFSYFARVSNAVAEVKTRALLEQAKIVLANSKVPPYVDVQQLSRELDARTIVTEDIIDQQLKPDPRERIRKLAKKQ